MKSRPRLATALATRSALAHSRANTARTLRLVPRPDFAGRESRRVGSRTLRGAVVRDVCCFVGSFGVLAFAIFSFFFADPGKQIYATDPVFFCSGISWPWHSAALVDVVLFQYAIEMVRMLLVSLRGGCDDVL